MRKLCSLMMLCLGLYTLAQDRTVGVISVTDGVYDGYTLFSPAGNTTTYLINNCGELVHQWDSQYFPGNSVYLMEDGSIYRASRVDGATLGEPGVGGRIERISWENEVIWYWEYSSDTSNQHHDFQVMPNGNLLVLAWDLKTFDEAVQAGRDPATLADNELWPDHIVEVNPEPNNVGEIVWVWHSWDHLIQDFDPTKDNYGVVEDNPGKIDINYRMTDGADWHHVNSIHYSPERDEIILSSPFFDEIWIIDHNTTTEEARGVKGDLLFRWGNPATYKRGDETDQKLFFQHTAQWLPDDVPNAGNIIIFNNGRGRTPEEYSSVVVLNPFNESGEYALDNGVFAPDTFVDEYVAPNPTDFYASFISGAQLLPNGSYLVNNGPVGTFFEVNTDDEIVWEYINPVSTTAGIVSQGDNIGGNLVFRAIKYGTDYPAFTGRSLSAIGFIELDPVDLEACVPLSASNENEQTIFYPNPAKDYIILAGGSSVEIYDLNGKMHIQVDLGNINTKRLVDIRGLKNGTYIVRMDHQTLKLIVNK